MAELDRIEFVKDLFLEFGIDVIEQSSIDNTSTIRWYLYLDSWGATINTSSPKNFSVTINGEEVSSTNYIALEDGIDKTIAEGTMTIPHVAGGTKTVSWSYSQQFDTDSFGHNYESDYVGGWVGTVSGSGSYELPKIAQRSTLQVANGTLGTSQNLKIVKEGNHAHSIKAVCGNSTVYIQKDGSLSTTEVKYTNTSITFTPPIEWALQNASGNTVSVEFTLTTYSADWSTNVVGSITYTRTFNIPAKSSLLVSNGTLGTPLTLNVSKQLDSLTHTITYQCGSVSGTICTKSSATSFTWNANNGNTLSLASQNPTGSSVSVAFTITAYSGNTPLSTDTKTITMSIPTEAAPSCSIDVSETIEVAKKYGYIKGISKLNINVIGYPSYGSEISSYKTTVNDKIYYTQTFITETLKSSGVMQITATVTDKRGRSGTTTIDIPVIEYSAPAVSSLAVHRCNSDGTENDEGAYVIVTYSGTITPLNNRNKNEWKLQYKKSTVTDYEEITLETSGYTVTNGTYIFRADTEFSYDVRVIAEDDFQSAVMVTSASTAYTIMDFGVDGKSIGLGKVAENENAVDVGFDAIFYGRVFGAAYGLGALPEISETDNLNNYTEPGSWSIPTNEQASAMKDNGLNVPINYAGKVVTENSSGQSELSGYKYRLQYYIPYMTIYPTMVRHLNKTGSSSWIYSPWKTLYFPTRDIDLTLKTGITPVRYTIARQGDIVTMYFAGKYNQSATSSPTTIDVAKLGSDFPGGAVSCVGAQNNKMITAWVTSEGEVKVCFTTSYTANTQFEFSLTWNVAATWT